jgi:hypothetical protein
MFCARGRGPVRRADKEVPTNGTPDATDGRTMITHRSRAGFDPLGPFILVAVGWPVKCPSDDAYDDRDNPTSEAGRPSASRQRVVQRAPVRAPDRLLQAPGLEIEPAAHPHPCSHLHPRRGGGRHRPGERGASPTGRGVRSGSGWALRRRQRSPARLPWASVRRSRHTYISVY